MRVLQQGVMVQPLGNVQKRAGKKATWLGEGKWKTGLKSPENFLLIHPAAGAAHPSCTRQGWCLEEMLLL